MGEIVFRKRKDGGYDVLIHSTEIDQGTFKTSYAYLGKATGIIHLESCDALKICS